VLATSIEYKGHYCFRDDWAGFSCIKPINIIIGRNNTGKSHMLDFVEVLAGTSPYKEGWETRCAGTLLEPDLREVFPENTRGGVLADDHWHAHGRLFVDHLVRWEVNAQKKVTSLEISGDAHRHRDARVQTERENLIKRRLERVGSPISGKTYRRLLADRDMQPEPESGAVKLLSNGSGATNIIRKYLVSSSAEFPRNMIQSEVRTALNKIFAQDGSFSEIDIQFHDHDQASNYKGQWEVYLFEETKGLVALSRSGSGLKTVLLVLLNLLVVPALEKQSKAQYVFAFEELENNLHPALLRNLLRYLEGYVQRENATLFLTTHSSVVLDYFGRSPEAQVIHVSHDGKSARTRPVAAHLDRIGIVSDLGAKPSDLMQANGIIWVEGPSDRIYINRWIELFSDRELREGRDYQCAFYGGALLARIQIATEEEAIAELANLFTINPNIFVVCDGDRTAASGEGSRIKQRVSRIRAEVNRLPSARIWITDAKEIENYLPKDVLSQVFSPLTPRAPTRFEHFFPGASAANSTPSFIEGELERKSIDKIELASKCAPYMSRDNLADRFDLTDQTQQIIDTIRSWNHI
jgi:hypothetical protein